MIEVTPAKSDSDFERLHDLFVAYEADLPEDLRHGAVPPIHELRATYGQDNAAFLALIGVEAIGCVAVRELDAQTALLLRLFVRPASRGLGAARLLSSAAIEFAKDGGYRRVVLDTNKVQLKAAYRLYRSLGFQECDAFTAVTYACPTFMELPLRNATD
jgi:putative acetyltransferase